MSAFNVLEPSRYRTANALVIAFRVAIVNSIHHDDPENSQVTSLRGPPSGGPFPVRQRIRYADLLDESTRGLDQLGADVGIDLLLAAGSGEVRVVDQGAQGVGDLGGPHGVGVDLARTG